MPPWKGHRPMLPLAGALALLCLSCSDRDPLRPEGGIQRQVSVTPTVEEGCARFEVWVSGRDRIEVRMLPDSSCGPLQPVLAGTPTFDVTRQRVRLPIALENRGQRKVKAPAWLLGWEDSLKVVSPAGLMGNRHTGEYLSFISPDSMVASTDSLLSDARIWKYDERLTTAGQPQVLGAGQRSAVRWIEMEVHPGVESFQATFRARARRAGNPVPMVPPDSIPARIFDESNVVTNPSHWTGPILRNVIRVLFADRATQEQRQAAVDAINGEVIGGDHALPAPEYLIQIPDDGTDRPLFAALDTLDRFPQVVAAVPFELDAYGPAYQRPSDGANWRKWELSPDQADGRRENWSLEAVAAPLAWGCETGDTEIPVAVVDGGFPALPDLAPNVSRDIGSGFDRQVGGVNDHGSSVASVVGARGNNGMGVTGMMWSASLRLYDYEVTFPKPSTGGGSVLSGSGASAYHGTPLNGLFRATQDGARVVNLSVARNWKGRTPDTPDDRRLVARSYSELSAQLRILIDQTQRNHSRIPLLVIAAGNDAVDAFFSEYPLLVKDFPDNVIVVGAAASAGVGRFERATWMYQGKLRGSNRGALVTVMAPGGGVYTLRGSGETRIDYGTSFAAPHVTGLAGLLLSFDPRIPTDTLKQLIVQGALRGNRLAGDKPLINAYESLKLAAARRGAPLCGNRVWMDGSNILVRREGANAFIDTIRGGLAGSGAMVQVLHGGHHIRVWDEGQQRTKLLGLQGTTWREVPDTIAGNSATLLSTYGWSHDQDSLAYLGGNGDKVYIRDRSYRSRLVATLPLNLSDNTESMCVLQLRRAIYVPGANGPIFSHYADPVCGMRVAAGSYTGATVSRPFYSPMGDRLLVSIDRKTSSTLTNSGWKLCPDITGMVENGTDLFECRDFSTVVSNQGSAIYSVLTRTGEVVPTGSAPRALQVSVAEGGQEYYVKRLLEPVPSSSGSKWHLEPRYFGGWYADSTEMQYCKENYSTLKCVQLGWAWILPTVSIAPEPEECRGEFYDLASARLLYQTEVRCDRDNLGTFAPSRTPAHTGVRLSASGLRSPSEQRPVPGNWWTDPPKRASRAP